MKAKAQELRIALSSILPVLRTRTTLPMLSCVKLEAAEGRLKATATDLDAYAAGSCPCEGDLEPVCVDFAMLNYLVKHGEEIELKPVGTRLMVIGAGKAYLAVLPAAEFYPWPTDAGQELNIDTADLADSINAVAWACDVNPKMTLDLWRECVWVHGTADRLETCACNGKEFAHMIKPLKDCSCDFSFPSKQAKLLVDSLNLGADEVRLGDRFVSTVSNTFAVAVKLAELRYPPIKLILEQTQIPIGDLPEVSTILDALHTIRALAPEETWISCRMEFSKEGISIFFQSDRANFERTIARPWEGEPKAVTFDVIRALKVFSHVPPNCKAAIGDKSLLFSANDCTYALALLHG